LPFDDLDDGFELGEVLVVQTSASRLLPDSFDRVQIRAVRRQIIQGEGWLLLFPPLLMQKGVVVFGIVADDDHLSAFAPAARCQLLEKIPKALGVEFRLFAPDDELAVAQAHRAKVADALACGMVQANRIVDLWRDPHLATGAMLLKMHLIQSPEINGWVGGQGQEFFYARPCVRREWLLLLEFRGPPADGVCGSEIQVVGKAAGTAAP
jgi:hypothetical protein